MLHASGGCERTHRLRKIVDTPDVCVAGVGDADTIRTGRVGEGIPEGWLAAPPRKESTRLTLVYNNAGKGENRLASLIKHHRAATPICAFPEQKETYVFRGKLFAGMIALEHARQGILSERMRAAGAGLAAFCPRTGVGIGIEGKEVKECGGVGYLLERPAHADSAFVRAGLADRRGKIRGLQCDSSFH